MTFSKFGGATFCPRVFGFSAAENAFQSLQHALA